jgi:hypothetical protein
MSRNLARRDQDRIETDVADRFVRVRREPNLRRSGDPPALPFIDSGGSSSSRAL